MQGNCTKLQLVSIAISLLSLALAATDLFLTLPTKGKPFKESSWKTKFLIVMPAMFMVFAPRIITISIAISYVKGYIFVLLGLIVILNLLINAHFLKRDPGRVMLGIFTNIFAPNIVVEDGSAFYKRSSIVPNFLYGIGQVLLLL